MITRRKFVRMAGVFALGGAFSACKGATPQPGVTPPSETPTPVPPVPTPSLAILLGGGDADIWAWKAQVRGAFKADPCESVEVQANGASIRGNMDGKQFSADVPIHEGKNEISATCPTGEASAAGLMYTGRLTNNPRSVIDIRLENARVVLDGKGSQPGPDGGVPIASYAWSARSTNPASLSILAPDMLAGKPLEGTVDALAITLASPETDGEYYITLRVADQAGREDASTTYFRVKGKTLQLDDWSWQNTDWVEQAVVYGIIPGKFGLHPFQDITTRLEYLRDLGVNALWLAPIQPSPRLDYGYAVMDYFHLREQYGTEEEFHKLVQEAHRLGIRVLMDFVPNHSSDLHPYFVYAEKYGKDSHYWDFYDRDENGQPTHYFDWTNLPNLNYENPEIHSWISEAFSHWVRDFNVDGFRVDAAWAIRERKPEYWPEWRKTLKRIKPDLLLLAEASAQDDFYFTDGFDAAYDWSAQVGHWAWEKLFQDPELITYNLNTVLTKNRQGYHEDALIFRFLNNNDTGSRFITRYGPEMNRVATVMLLTLPGIPCVYTGDEIGAEFKPYEDPFPLNWEEDSQGLLEFHKNLIHLRLSTPALCSRKMQIVEVEPHRQVFAYVRYTENGDPPALVLLNFLDKPAQVEMKLPEAFADFTSKGELRDLLTGASFQAGEAITLPMEPTSARILVI